MGRCEGTTNNGYWGLTGFSEKQHKQPLSHDGRKREREGRRKEGEREGGRRGKEKRTGRREGEQEGGRKRTLASVTSRGCVESRWDYKVMVKCLTGKYSIPWEQGESLGPEAVMTECGERQRWSGLN